MKKNLFLMLSLALAASACIDSDYDLGKIETDHITVGGTESVFEIPLATVAVTLEEIRENGVDIEEVLGEANIWLPDRIPGGVDYVEIDRMQREEAYLIGLLDALLDEMGTNPEKLEAVCDLVWRKHSDSFLPLLNSLPSGIEVTEEVFKLAFKAEFATNTAVRDQAKSEASQYLADISLDPLTYQVGSIDLGKEVIDMLVSNLDAPDVPDARNTLDIYGTMRSALPFGATLDALFFTQNDRNPKVTIENLDLKADAESVVPPTRLDESDLRALIAGVRIDVPLELTKYYPAKSFQKEVAQQIAIEMHLRKRGGLSLEL